MLWDFVCTPLGHLLQREPRSPARGPPRAVGAGAAPRRGRGRGGDAPGTRQGHALEKRCAAAAPPAERQVPLRGRGAHCVARKQERIRKRKQLLSSGAGCPAPAFQKRCSSAALQMLGRNCSGLWGWAGPNLSGLSGSDPRLTDSSPQTLQAPASPVSGTLSKPPHPGPGSQPRRAIGLLSMLEKERPTAFGELVHRAFSEFVFQDF